MSSNFTQAGFEEIVRAAKEHIAAGDIFQVVLSQRFDLDVEVEPSVRDVEGDPVAVPDEAEARLRAAVKLDPENKAAFYYLRLVSAAS